MIFVKYVHFKVIFPVTLPSSFNFLSSTSSSIFTQLSTELYHHHKVIPIIVTKAINHFSFHLLLLMNDLSSNALKNDDPALRFPPHLPLPALADVIQDNSDGLYP